MPKSVQQPYIFLDCCFNVCLLAGLRKQEISSNLVVGQTSPCESPAVRLSCEGQPLHPDSTREAHKFICGF